MSDYKREREVNIQVRACILAFSMCLNRNIPTDNASKTKMVG